MKKTLMLSMTAVLILIGQNAFAGTQVYVSIGIPAVQISSGYADPHAGYAWVEGYYYVERPRKVWVPGHWERIAPPRHAVYRPGPGECRPYRNDYRHDGQPGYRDGNRCPQSHDDRQSPQGQRNHDRNQSYDGKGRTGTYAHPQNQPGGNWMNNINNQVIKRQINYVQ